MGEHARFSIIYKSVILTPNRVFNPKAKGDVITGIPAATADSKVFHAGTTEKDGQILTSGGRVLCAVGLGNTVNEAQMKAYEVTKQIKWNGVNYRNDIGYRAILREKS